MKHIPILFSTEMVQAILDGRKTQTRRVVKQQPPKEFICGYDIHQSFTGKPSVQLFEFYDTNTDSDTAQHWPADGKGIKCPYGQPGDVLWVREGWRLKGWDFEDGTMAIGYEDGTTTGTFAYDPTNDSMWLLKQVEQLEDGGYIEKDPNNPDAFRFTEKKQPFKLARFMPKEACRLWLQVKAVRVERLQKISNADAKAEGVAHVIDKITGYCGYDYISGSYNLMTTPWHGFASLWRKLNGEQSWKANPWVWVIEFERCEMPENFLQAKPEHINEGAEFNGFM